MVPQKSVKRLTTKSLDLAVARGAAYYGRVRRGLGVAIGGGLPRTYYLKIDVKDALGQLRSQALTLLPRGSQEEAVFRPEQAFSLRPNMPVAFHLLTSHVRLEDQAGDLISIDPVEMQALPPIQTILRFGHRQIQEDSQLTLPVCLAIRLTAIGTIEIWLESKDSEHIWQLEFQIKSAVGQDSNIVQQAQLAPDETFNRGYLEGAKQLIKNLFSPVSSLKPSQIMEHLEAKIGMPRREWKSSLLRELWASILKSAPHRKLSTEYEGRWWNLAGFTLRPGFGFPLDDFRIKELWKIILADLKGPKTAEVFAQMCICLRRVAGGFSKGQQMQLASELMESFFDKRSGKIEVKRKSELYLYSETIRTLAALERLDMALKIKLGNALVKRLLCDLPANHDYWALGRIGGRCLVYGSIGQIVPKENVSQWIEQLLCHQPATENREAMLFLLRQLARKTDQRELNISDFLIKKVLETYSQENLKEYLLEEKELTELEREQVFGDQLPAGLILNL